MAKDLRRWLTDLEKRFPGEPLRVTRLVHPESFEISSILYQLEKRGNRAAVLFEKVTNLKGGVSEFSILAHTFINRDKIALSLESEDSSRTALFEKYLAKSREKKKIKVVDPADAPVKEFIHREGALDLADLPIMRHNFMDGGPYLTPVVIARSPDGERYNTSWNRMMYIDSHHLAIYMSPRHLWAYFQDLEAKEEPMPIGIVLGHHMAFMLSASSLTSLDEDEYEAAGGLLGESLRVVPSETYGDRLLIPADAEIVLEGEIVPRKRTIEGPFGEFTFYLGAQRVSWLVRVRAITHRIQPILHFVYGAHLDHLRAHFPIEASIYQRVKQAVPGVKDVSWLESGGSFHLAISLKKRTEGEPMRAAMAALSASNFIKHVFVIDDDLDPGNPGDVMWAVANCVQSDTSITLLKNIQGQLLDPSIRQETKGAGMIIDATRPLDRPFPPRANVPPEALKLRLEDYLNIK